MSEGMWSYFLFDTSKFLIFIDKFFDTVSTKSLPITIVRETDEKIIIAIAPEFKIDNKFVSCLL